MQTLEFIPSASGSLPKDHRLLEATVEVKAQEDPAQRCTICDSLFNLPRSDGLVEKASTLPCSHVFGNICIERWLETSMHNDCPVCRRSMRYRNCQHIIRACEVGKSPEIVRESDMPERCGRCRVKDVGVGELGDRMEMMKAQKRALRGMKRCLPGVFGEMCRSTVESVEGRVEEVRRDLEWEVDAVFEEMDNEGRLEW